MVDVSQTPYLRLREGRAEKLGARASGAIHYAVLTDPDRRQVFITLTRNEGSGGFSKEVVPLRDIEEALADVAEGGTFASKQLRTAFVGKSACNGGFLSAVLKAEGLVAPAPDVKHQLVRRGDWARWQAEVLALDGEPILIPPLPGGSNSASPAAVPSVQGSPATPSGGRKSRRGGNRLVAVDATPGEGDEDPA